MDTKSMSKKKRKHMENENKKFMRALKDPEMMRRMDLSTIIPNTLSSAVSEVVRSWH